MRFIQLPLIHSAQIRSDSVNLQLAGPMSVDWSWLRRHATVSSARTDDRWSSLEMSQLQQLVRGGRCGSLQRAHLHTRLGKQDPAPHAHQSADWKEEMFSSEHELDPCRVCTAVSAHNRCSTSSLCTIIPCTSAPKLTPPTPKSPKTAEFLRESSTVVGVLRAGTEI